MIEPVEVAEGSRAPVNTINVDEVDTKANLEPDGTDTGTDASMGSDRISLAASNNLSMESIKRWVVFNFNFFINHVPPGQVWIIITQFVTSATCPQLEQIRNHRS